VVPVGTDRGRTKSPFDEADSEEQRERGNESERRERADVSEDEHAGQDQPYSAYAR
jgi:hypothetical protein